MKSSKSGKPLASEEVMVRMFLKKLLTPTLRNSLEYTYREEGKAYDDSK